MKVKYIGCSDAQANWGSGQIYELTFADEHSWHTLYYLEGIDGGFNSVCFEKVE